MLLTACTLPPAPLGCIICQKIGCAIFSAQKWIHRDFFVACPDNPFGQRERNPSAFSLGEILGGGISIARPVLVASVYRTAIPFRDTEWMAEWLNLKALQLNWKHLLRDRLSFWIDLFRNFKEKGGSNPLSNNVFTIYSQGGSKYAVYYLSSLRLSASKPVRFLLMWPECLVQLKTFAFCVFHVSMSLGVC